ncbi:hypothetical protein N0V95_007365 [Ascochyta clinopodiicola]|nr:hypothetical protein N0V95_007365 [Ascochyta clinopodiicola]
MTSSSAVSNAKKPEGSAGISNSSATRDVKEKKISSTPAKDDGKDRKENDEESASFHTTAIPDTLDARLAFQELRVHKSTDNNPPEEGIDGPLFLALLMGNNNNNANAAKQPAPDSVPAPDTLDVSFAVHEVLGPSGIEATDEDGPLIFALMLGNQNNNNQPNPNAKDVVPDTLDSKLAVMEVMGTQHSGTPPVLKMRGAAQTVVLTDEQVQFYKDNGYLVVPDALSSDSVAELLQSVHESAEAIATGGPGAKKQVFDKWTKNCVNPNGRVIAALTERAFQPNTTPLQHIQRLGCGVHRVLSAFRHAIMSAPHVSIAKALGYTDPRVVQSLVIVKAAHVGAKVVPHQDGCTSFTDPPSCATFWYALEDADAQNGCLAVAARSHLVTPITRRCRADAEGMPVFEPLEEPVFADVKGVSDGVAPPERDEDGNLVFKELEVKAGTLVLMHGNLLHTSAENQSGKNRVAFNFGVVEGALGWRGDSYLQPYEGWTEFERLHVC